MSTTFEKLIFRGARENTDGKLTVEFFTKDMKHGRSYTIHPHGSNQVARNLSNRTLIGMLSYGKKKYRKRGHTVLYSLSKLEGKEMLCEIHDECMGRFESHRLQTVIPKKK